MSNPIPAAPAGSFRTGQAELEQAAMALAEAECRAGEATDALTRFESRAAEAKDIILRKRSGIAVNSAALAEAELFRQKATVTRAILERAHADALRELATAKRAWDRLLPQAPQRTYPKTPRIVELA